MMKRIFIGLFAIIMLVTAACSANPQIETTEPSEQSGGSFYLRDTEVFQVATPYCILKYPVKWESFVATDVKESETLYSVSYYAKLNGEQIPLFTIDIGENSEGFVLGVIETKDGQKTVYMIDHSNEYEGVFTTENEDKFLEMCEDVNVIIASLVNEGGMLLP